MMRSSLLLKLKSSVDFLSYCRLKHQYMATNQPEPSTQQLLAALLQSAAQQNQNLDALTHQVGQQTQHLDVLTDQVGHLTEVLHEQMGSLGAKIDTLTDVVTIGFSELKAITQEQSETAKQQAETAKQQTESISRLAATVERQAQIVERLLPQRLGQ